LPLDESSVAGHGAQDGFGAAGNLIKKVFLTQFVHSDFTFFEIRESKRPL
jgi:hypothetical protein